MPEVIESNFSLLISDIEQENLTKSNDIALRTEQLLEKLIAHGKWKSARELMDLIKKQMRLLLEAVPHEPTAVNIMRHVLKVIRDEYDNILKTKGEGQSLHSHLVAPKSHSESDYSRNLDNLKQNLLDNLTEYKVELESSMDNIAAQASEHIHTNERILTVGKSKTVEKFLKSVAKDRKFHVIVVEGAPMCYGHQMAASLAKSNIQTTVVPDAAVFAMMSRVNKVIIGTHTVLANGGLRAACGMHAVALAAKHYSVPVMVLSHIYKFAPIYVGSHEDDSFNVMRSPNEVMSLSDGPLLNNIDVVNPVFDYVPPELVTLFIWHQGGNAPSYVYRILTELYHQDDYDI